MLVTAAALAAVTSCAQTTFTPRSSPVMQQAEVEQTNVAIDKDQMLSAHNAIRQRLGVPPLRWSTNLESLASSWANYLSTDTDCSIRRRGSIGLPRHKNGIGENLQLVEAVRFDDGRTEKAAIDERQVVLSWARQGIDYDYTTNKCALNKNCGHYTQLVWRDSQVVGCAAASCSGEEQIWVCNYDPPGNYVNQKPY